MTQYEKGAAADLGISEGMFRDLVTEGWIILGEPVNGECLIKIAPVALRRIGKVNRRVRARGASDHEWGWKMHRSWLACHCAIIDVLKWMEAIHSGNAVNEAARINIIGRLRDVTNRG